LMSEDLPTFDRPMKAYSGKSGFGHSFSDGLLFTNSAFKKFKDSKIQRFKNSIAYK